MAAALDFLLSAPGIIALFTAAALWLALRPQSLPARRFLLCLSGAYLLASIYTVPLTIANTLLTRRLRPLSIADVPKGKTAIVILGAGGGTVRAEAGQAGIMNYDTAARMLEGYRVFRMTNAEWIISSGGLVTQERPNETSAEMMRDGLVRLGVPVHRIVLEPVSADTHDEALAVATLLRPLGAQHVILVTSDIHMTRAAGAFRAAGIRVIQAPAADARWPQDLRDRILPTNHGLDYTDRVLHELIGIAYYVARGWE